EIAEHLRPHVRVVGQTEDHHQRSEDGHEEHHSRPGQILHRDLLEYVVTSDIRLDATSDPRVELESGGTGWCKKLQRTERLEESRRLRLPDHRRKRAHTPRVD